MLNDLLFFMFGGKVISGLLGVSWVIFLVNLCFFYFFVLVFEFGKLKINR